VKNPIGQHFLPLLQDCRQPSGFPRQGEQCQSLGVRSHCRPYMCVLCICVCMYVMRCTAMVDLSISPCEWSTWQKQKSTDHSDRTQYVTFMHRVGQNRIYTSYMTVYVMIPLPKKTNVHRICMVLANPIHAS